MNKLFLVAIFLSVALFNVEALSKKKLANTVAAVAPPKFKNNAVFLEGETSAFELVNFYEYVFYVRAYELYNNYSLNRSLCKNTYFVHKRLDAISTASFCKLIAGQLNTSYLNYICGYIQSSAGWFACYLLEG